MTTSLAPLAPLEIRARRRPLAIFWVFAAELAWALVMSAPAHAWARRAWGAHPEGDAVLWDPGGRHLLVWLGQNDGALPMTSRLMMLLLLVGVVIMQLPLGALLVSLAFSRSETVAPDPEEDEENEKPKPRPGALRSITAMRVGLGAFLPLAGLLALGSLVAIIVLAIGTLAASALDRGLAESVGDARSFVFRLLTLALFAAVAALIGVVIDLARAAAAREVGLAAASSSSASPPGWSVMGRALATALRTARAGGLRRAALAWAWRSALGVGLIGAGYLAAQMLGGRGGAALVGLFVIHQLVVLGRVGLRASWLARATAMIAPVQDAASVKAP